MEKSCHRFSRKYTKKYLNCICWTWVLYSMLILLYRECCFIFSFYLNYTTKKKRDMKCLALFFHYRCHVLLWAFPFHYSNFFLFSFISFYFKQNRTEEKSECIEHLGGAKKWFFSFFHTLFFGISSSQLRFCKWYALSGKRKMKNDNIEKNFSFFIFFLLLHMMLS